MSGLEPFFIMAATGAKVLSQIVETNTQTAVAKANAAAEERRANEERAVSQNQAQERQRLARVVGSQQQAAFAASGGGLGGSAADVMAETAGRGELNAERELWQGETRARGLEDQAAITRAAAKASQRALPLQIGATILTGASSLSSRLPGGSAYNDPYGSATGRRYRYDSPGGWDNTVTWG